jgi:hypothetical protein
MIGSRVMVPLRGVFEDMGAEVKWNEARQEVTAMNGTKTIILHVNDQHATVDGNDYVMDAAPMKMMDRVFVPLRFLGETLGAEVKWEPTSYAVYINTSAVATTGNNTGTVVASNAITIEESTVIPLLLNDNLSSKTAHKGDTFTATVNTKGELDYADLPRGTIVQGHVEAVTAKTNNQPGMLDLAFDRMVLPGGAVQNLDVSIINLDSKDIHTENGVMVANQTTKKDDLKYVGYGAGAGVLLAVLTKGNILTNGVIGGAIGYLFGLTQKDATKFHDVELKPNAEMGIQLNRDLVFNRSK